MYRFFIICSLAIMFANCNFSAGKASANETKNALMDSVIATDTLYAKNLKALANFADTLFIESYYPEIKHFIKDDSLHPNRKVDVVFTGSSSIRKWQNLKSDMNGFNVLNRGFGGSTVPQTIYYSNELIFKHHPSIIVFYSGENDISTTNTDTNKVFLSFRYFQKLVQMNLPQTQLYFISIKPSPARWAWWSEMQSINNKIKLFCDSTENCSFIDVSSEMLNNNGKVRNELFIADKLHLNEKGYEIWAKKIKEALEGKIDKRL